MAEQDIEKRNNENGRQVEENCLREMRRIKKLATQLIEAKETLDTMFNQIVINSKWTMLYCKNCEYEVAFFKTFAGVNLYHTGKEEGVTPNIECDAVHNAAYAYSKDRISHIAELSDTVKAAILKRLS